MTAAMNKNTRDSLLAELLAGKLPDAEGRFGPYGGRYIPETLVPAFDRLERRGARSCRTMRRSATNSTASCATGSGVPRRSPRCAICRSAGARRSGSSARISRTPARTRSTTRSGQALMAQRVGAKRIVAETGAGQHGVATAAACARVGLPCTVYMGEVDMERQAPNVGRMRLMGATVVPVTSGDRTLRAAIDEAFRDWVADPSNTFYCLGSALGPHPYPYLVRELQSIIGREARAQMLERTGASAGLRGGLRRRWLQCHRPFHAFLGDAVGGDHRRGSRWSRPGLGDNAARHGHRPSRRAAWHVLAAAAGRGRPGAGDAFGVRGSRLSGRGSGARAAARDRPRELHHGAR